MSDIDVEKLLFLIESRSPIYNFKLKEHSDKRIIEQLWNEIANELESTVIECKSKYTTLRNSYARFLRQNAASGPGTGKKKKVWYLSGAMSFLKDYMMVHRRPAGSSIEQDTIEDDSRSLSSIPEVKIEPKFEDWRETSIEYNNTSASSGSKTNKLTEAPAPAALPIADEEVEKLLFLIENRPPIYNFKLKEHSDKRITEKLWKEIADEMETSVTECKTKYTTLRISYARFLRQNTPPLTGFAAKRKKIWYLSGVMSFLKDFMMSHRKTTDEYSIEPDTIEDDSLTSTIPGGMPEEFDDWVEQSTDYNNTSAPSGSKKRKLTAAVERIAEPVAEYLKAKLEGNEGEDSNLTFFKSVLPDLNKLSDRRQRKVKQDFLFNLNKLLDEQEIE